MYQPETCVLAETLDSADTLDTGRYMPKFKLVHLSGVSYTGSHFGMINIDQFSRYGMLTTLLVSLLSYDEWCDQCATAKPHFSRYQLIS